jgi:hypothetical protein
MWKSKLSDVSLLGLEIETYVKRTEDEVIDIRLENAGSRTPSVASWSAYDFLES